ncbi:MAG: hypothetical protein ACKODU_00930 [Limnohabitans sp.]
MGIIQNLVDIDELQAWKTQGGHHCISMQTLRNFQRRRNILAEEWV